MSADKAFLNLSSRNLERWPLLNSGEPLPGRTPKRWCGKSMLTRITLRMGMANGQMSIRVLDSACDPEKALAYVLIGASRTDNAEFLRFLGCGPTRGRALWRLTGTHEADRR
jgi:hypothetical protein